jgi:hypothetical protein
LRLGKGGDERFYYFEGTWDNTGPGSVIVGHLAVDKRTTDVWDAIVCRYSTYVPTDPHKARIESSQQIRHQAGISMNYHFCRQGGIMRHIYAHAVLDKNPIAYYRLAETSGPKVHDKTGNGHTGVVGGAGAPSFSEPGAILSDPEDTAIAFDGQSYIEIPNDPVFSQPTSQTGLTVEAWLRPDRLDFDGEAPIAPIFIA